MGFEEVQEAGCRGKVRYSSRKWAKKAAKLVARNRNIKGLHPYECDFCALWHLGHARGQATHRRFDAIAAPEERWRM